MLMGRPQLRRNWDKRIDEAVDRGVVAGIYASREGRPSYPPLTMVIKWYNLR